MYLYDFVIHLLYSDTLLPQIPSNSVNGDILSTKSVYCTLDCRIFMCNEPFVLSCQQAVLACLSCLKCKICIGSCRKYDYTLETAILYIAWRIMKCSCIYFNTCSCRYQECFDLRSIICKIICDILLASDKQHQICYRYIDL